MRRHDYPEYACWLSMRRRCTSPDSPNWKYYGGKGVKMCSRWYDSFFDFISDMGPRPFPNSQIDRIDSNGDYCKDNCRWASPKENARARSTTKLNKEVIRVWFRLYTLCGFTLHEIAEIYGVSVKLVSRCFTGERWEDVLSKEERWLAKSQSLVNIARKHRTT